MIQADYEALDRARARQKTAEFKQEYSLRSGIEGTILQGIRGFNFRAVYRRGHFQPAKVRCFIDFLLEEFDRLTVGFDR
jgi:DNA-binding transcriptional LysR family regulator